MSGADRKRRVVVFQREDGFFGLREEYWYSNHHDGQLISEGWAKLAAEKSVFASIEKAEAEADVRFAGLSLHKE